MTTEKTWQPKEGPLMTRWAREVSPETVHPEYPRPQMVRERWQNLNGLWDYALRPVNDARPGEYDGTILVPFPVESALSGVMKRADEQKLWYRRTFEVPASWREGRVLLHFGAVDWDTVVWVNGAEVGTHRGGYDPFSFDVTDALTDEDEQEIVISVRDPTDEGIQPIGKQTRTPRKIWYVPTTGIWQTVWLEPVPQAFVERLKLTPDVDAGALRLNVAGHNADGLTVRALASDGGEVVAEISGDVGQTLALPIPDAKLWSPESPFLYDLQVTLLRGGETVDEVTSYFGMRKVSLKQVEGQARICLNDEPIFQYGPLDQGFWPDGLYTPPTDAALRYDLEVTKDLGFNMVRKHVKVESARLYYHADKLGLLMWQDMPNGDKIVGKGNGEMTRSPESAAQFELELERMLDALHNSPCIVVWVPFNESWGQYDTARVAAWVKAYDPSRLVNSVSGWNDIGAGGVHDIHDYPGPAAPPPEAGRAAVLGEFGGLGLPLHGHTWQNEANWGYRSYSTQAELTEAYLALLDELKPLVKAGLSAAVYTQTTDVEIEVNGLMTYDREVLKLDASTVREVHKALYE